MFRRSTGWASASFAETRTSKDRAILDIADSRRDERQRASLGPVHRQRSGCGCAASSRNFRSTHTAVDSNVSSASLLISSSYRPTAFELTAPRRLLIANSRLSPAPRRNSAVRPVAELSTEGATSVRYAQSAGDSKPPAQRCSRSCVTFPWIEHEQSEPERSTVDVGSGHWASVEAAELVGNTWQILKMRIPHVFRTMASARVALGSARSLHFKDG